MSKKENKKAARKAAKETRRAKLAEIIHLASSTPDVPEEFENSDFAERFTEYWPLLRAGLEFVEDSWLTGKKTDEALQHIVAVGDNVTRQEVESHEMEDFIEKIQKIWDVVSRVLYVATVFTNDDTDEVLEKIIDIGNWVTGEDE